MDSNARRYELQTRLENILGSDNVYYNPPQNIRLSYPCIVYSMSRKNISRADNVLYKVVTGYDITFMHINPDDSIDAKLLGSFSNSSFNRSFILDNIYHDVYLIYF